MVYLAHTDGITIICPSCRDLNNMLLLCNTFGHTNYIIFNAKMTVCGNYRELVNDNIYLYNVQGFHVSEHSNMMSFSLLYHVFRIILCKCLSVILLFKLCFSIIVIWNHKLLYV